MTHNILEAHKCFSVPTPTIISFFRSSRKWASKWQRVNVCMCACVLLFLFHQSHIHNMILIFGTWINGRFRNVVLARSILLARKLVKFYCNTRSSRNRRVISIVFTIFHSNNLVDLYTNCLPSSLFDRPPRLYTWLTKPFYFKWNYFRIVLWILIAIITIYI